MAPTELTAPASIRPARPEEIDRLIEIEAAAATLFPPERLPGGPSTLSGEALREACDSGWLWVVEADAHPVGFAAARGQSGCLHLLELDVDPAYGRRGLGRRLLQHVLRQASQLGFRAVTLTTFADLPWNGPFYESLGFQALPEHDLPPHLADALAQERAAGLSRRTAMRFTAPNHSRACNRDRQTNTNLL